MARGATGATRARVYAFVERRLLEGAPPTVREVQRAFGFRAVQSAQQHLAALVAEGRLDRQQGLARGFRLPGPPVPAPRLVPLLGRVQAGALTTAAEDLEGYLPVEMRRAWVRNMAGGAGGRASARGGVAAGRAGGGVAAAGRATGDAIDGEPDLFALRVRGDSMTGAGILDGDVVVVRRQPTARSGDVVVALVGDEATVKTLRLGRGRVELLPANPAFAPIVIEAPGEVVLLGRVIEVRRYLDRHRG